MKVTLLIMFALLAFRAQSQNQYGMHPTALAEYKTSVKASPEKELVDLGKVIPGIVMDIRYATKNNFTGAKVYHLARAYARMPVAEALKKAQTDFRQLGYGIKFMMRTGPIQPSSNFLKS
jgi:D-alanyl-D-alanine dipeptidase